MFVKMKPVCDCGFIFKELIIEKTKYIGVNIDIRAYPAICPKCGEIIEGVIYQTPTDNIFDYNENKFLK